MIYITDCEGPVLKNDNAYEIAEAFLHEGGRFFSLLSKFDDYLGDIEKVEGYKYGSALIFILPFLKAADVTDRKVRGFSGRCITVVKGIKETLQVVSSLMDVYVVSTSYVHYIEEVCQYLGLKMENMFCTRVSFNDYGMEEDERRVIAEYQERFLSLPAIAWDDENRIPPESQHSIDVLKEFFCSNILKLPVYRWMKEIKPIGGRGKAEAILLIARRTGVTLADIIYVGDSITDTEVLQLVREGGGVAVSFNGNRYAVQSAEYIVVSHDAAVLSNMASAFFHQGREAVREGRINEVTHVFRRDACDLREVIALSEKTRKEVRGQAIGSLG